MPFAQGAVASPLKYVIDAESFTPVSILVPRGIDLCVRVENLRLTLAGSGHVNHSLSIRYCQVEPPICSLLRENDNSV